MLGCSQALWVVLIEKALADPRVAGWLLVRSSGKSKETQDSLGVGGPVITWIARASHRDGRGRRLVVVDNDNRTEIRQFLTARRARISPEQAGLPTYGSNRRVAGLRREEVALLAGVSVDYYTRLERGNLGGVSEAVLDALARALQLDEAERGHLFDLARAANTTARPRRRPAPQRVRPGAQRILDAITDVPADLRNGRRDILAANRLGYALYSELYVDPVRPANVARFVFLSPRAREFFPDWEGVASDLVANLRTEAGRNPHDRGLQDLIGELSTRSQEFRSRWAAHNVRLHQTGRKRLCHPVVGDLELTYEVLALPADPGLSLVVYGAEPGSASQDGLRLLASWAATLDQAEPAQAPDQR
jgi:transcriptional regulator with XRE-family HTH domain